MTTKKFSDLRAYLSDHAQARAVERTQAMLLEATPQPVAKFPDAEIKLNGLEAAH